MQQLTQLVQTQTDMVIAQTRAMSAPMSTGLKLFLSASTVAP